MVCGDRLKDEDHLMVRAIGRRGSKRRGKQIEGGLVDLGNSRGRLVKGRESPTETS